MGVGRHSLDVNQLDIEQERRIGRDDVARTARAVAEFRRDCQFTPAAHLHAHHPFVPAFDDLADTDHELEWLAAITRTIELAAVRQRARVVYTDRLTGLRAGAR